MIHTPTGNLGPTVNLFLWENASVDFRIEEAKINQSFESTKNILFKVKIASLLPFLWSCIHNALNRICACAGMFANTFFVLSCAGKIDLVVMNIKDLCMV
jgi:hypothetical protein